MNILLDCKKETFILPRINNLSKTNLKNLINDSEELYHKQIDDITNDIVLNGKYKIILLAGPSSSGKQHHPTYFVKNWQNTVMNLWLFLLTTFS